MTCYVSVAMRTRNEGAGSQVALRKIIPNLELCQEIEYRVFRYSKLPKVSSPIPLSWKAARMLLYQNEA